jgi:hypothetical protein
MLYRCASTGLVLLHELTFFSCTCAALADRRQRESQVLAGLKAEPAALGAKQDRESVARRQGTRAEGAGREAEGRPGRLEIGAVVTGRSV